MPKPKGIRAYIVTCLDDDHGADVVFAESHREARQRRDQSTCDCEFIDWRARRAPELDQYAPGPVSMVTLMGHGWVARCQNCEGSVYEDFEFVARNDGNTVFCCQQCADECDAYWKKVRLAQRLGVINHPPAHTRFMELEDDDIATPAVGAAARAEGRGR